MNLYRGSLEGESTWKTSSSRVKISTGDWRDKKACQFVDVLCRPAGTTSSRCKSLARSGRVPASFTLTSRARVVSTGYTRFASRICGFNYYCRPDANIARCVCHGFNFTPLNVPRKRLSLSLSLPLFLCASLGSFRRNFY